MTQSEQLMSGVKFRSFSVDVDGFKSYLVKFDADFDEAVTQLAQYGLLRFNSVKEKKEWLEALGCDCSRGCGKEVYEDPVNMAAHPAEMGALQRVQKLETLRRKNVTFAKKVGISL